MLTWSNQGVPAASVTGAQLLVLHCPAFPGRPTGGPGELLPGHHTHEKGCPGSGQTMDSCSHPRRVAQTEFAWQAAGSLHRGCGVMGRGRP